MRLHARMTAAELARDGWDCGNEFRGMAYSLGIPLRAGWEQLKPRQRRLWWHWFAAGLSASTPRPK